MHISSVRIRPIEGGGHLKAVASVVFDDAFAVHDLKIIASDSRLFVAMPSKKLPDGSRRDIAHPIHPDMRESMENKVLDEYRKQCLS